MGHSMKRFCGLFWVIGLILCCVGCRSAEPVVVALTAVPEPSRTPVPVVPTETAVVVPTVSPEPSAEPTVIPEPTAIEPMVVEVRYLRPEIVATYPHDTSAFTQGLVWYEGGFYESTGLRGESSLRRVNLDGTVVQFAPVDAAYFAEGLALMGDQLIQLTWQSQVAFVYDQDNFTQVGSFFYSGEGWGLCYSEETGTLWMSDGSSTITEREADTFQPLNRIDVLLNGTPVSRLNELECVGGDIYANVWQTDQIMQIDRKTGSVTAVIDAQDLLTPEERASLTSNDVLNGIAYDSDQDLFYITGKRWPKLFAVDFVSP